MVVKMEEREMKRVDRLNYSLWLWWCIWCLLMRSRTWVSIDVMAIGWWLIERESIIVQRSKWCNWF